MRQNEVLVHYKESWIFSVCALPQLHSACQYIVNNREHMPRASEGANNMNPLS